MRRISTGEPSTLGVYIKLVCALFGEESPAVAFLTAKAARSPDGEDEEVLASETQMIQLLASIDRGES